MPTTYSAAIDEMFGTAKSVLDSETMDLLGYEPDIRFAGVGQPNIPEVTRLWARVTSQIVTDEQASLSNANDVRFFEAIGILFIQLFCPRSVGNSLVNGRLIAEALQNAFRHTSPSGEMWYRNARIVELAETDQNYPINVMVRFEYKTLSHA